jgi:hypothetical protein
LLDISLRGCGVQPPGLVWLFKDFDNVDITQTPQFLSDHLSHQNRVAALEQHFRENPWVFGKFDTDRGSAMAFVATENAPVVFLALSAGSPLLPRALGCSEPLLVQAPRP